MTHTHKKDQIALAECAENMIKNLERLLNTERDHDEVSKILSMRWFIANEVCPKTN